MPVPASYYSAEDLERAAVFLQDVLEAGGGTIEMELICKDGRKVPTEYRVSVIYGGQGEPEYILSIGRDVTRRKQTEKMVQEEKVRAQKYLDIAGVMFIAIDTNGEVTLANQKGREILGYNSDEIIGRNWFDSFVPMNMRDDTRIVFNKLMDGDIEPVEYYENSVLTKGGEERIVAWRNTIVKDDDGNITGSLSSGEDITERKQAEEALRESEIQYRTLFEAASDAILMVQITDEGAYVSDCNSRTIEMFGCTREHLIGKPPADLSPPVQPDGRSTVDRIKQIVRTGMEGVSQCFEWSNRRPDGTCFDAEVSLNRIDISGKPYMQAIIRDITERKQAEEELRNAFAEIKGLKEELESENIQLKREVQRAHLPGEMIARSETMKSALIQAERVAATDSTVLLSGETGTGKELMARSIHNMSARKSGPLVVVNCSAVPVGLIESELFGHEKGAYTGAHARQIGRFEAAKGGTIFLDEIGELPLEIQVKLLRVLQERRVERLGNHKSIDVDVRIIAATNRDLEQAVRDGAFREDLFFRLNVFPITIPPLRKRPEDIDELVRVFVEEFSRSMGKRVEKISRTRLERLRSYHWPGNIRELRNIVERAMIQMDSGLLRIDIPEPADRQTSGVQALDDVERNHIVSVLERTNWRVRGAGGAAELLRINPSTLDSRLKKLRIVRPSQ
jgi:PAS domain S-box-containing protein